MRIRHGVPVAAVALAALGGLSMLAMGAGGCKPGKAAPGDGGAPTATSGDVAPQTTPAELCEQSFGGAATAMLAKCEPSDKDTGEYKMIAAFGELASALCTQTLSSAVGKQRISFDGAKAGGCASALRAASRSSLAKRGAKHDGAAAPAACDGVVVGLEDAGQPCADDLECKDGLACVGNGNPLDVEDGGAVKDGVCARPGASGAKCARATASSLGAFGAHPTCAPGTFCEELEHTCRPAGGSSAKCTSDAQCVAGLSCHLAKCGAEPPQAAGGPCLEARDCQDGLFCDGANAFDEPPKPGKCAAKKPAGAACKASDDCLGRCDTGDAGILSAKGTCASFCGSG